MPKKKLKLTDKQAAFVKNYAIKLRSFTAAAREAGYADPSGEIDRLKSNPDVMTAIAQLQRAELCTWRGGVLKARKVLDEAMDPVVVAIDEHGKTHFLAATTKDRIAAASKMLDCAGKFDAQSLLEKAQKEDKRDKTTIVDEVLGAESPATVPLPETVPGDKSKVH